MNFFAPYREVMWMKLKVSWEYQKIHTVLSSGCFFKIGIIIITASGWASYIDGSLQTVERFPLSKNMYVLVGSSKAIESGNLASPSISHTVLTLLRIISG